MKKYKPNYELVFHLVYGGRITYEYEKKEERDYIFNEISSNTNMLYSPDFRRVLFMKHVISIEKGDGVNYTIQK